MRVLLAALFCHLIFCGPLVAAQQPEITGAVAYTEIIRFDYTKDGIRNQVQFWLEFKGSPAMGEPGEEGYIPESGAIYYYLVDVENKKQVDNWLMGFSMMEEPPPRGPYPMKNIDIMGNQSTFEAFGMKWKIIDGGADYTKDTVTIDDGFRVHDMKMFSGDLKVFDARIADYADYQECMECHESSAAKMVAKGGRHNEMGCSGCHIGHPPEVEDPYMQCIECHQPHSEQMAEQDCNRCHKAHTATEVTYAFDVPSQYCTVCHQTAAEFLKSSRSKHSDIECARCHQETHKATVSCQYCHGGPHPEHVMSKIGICGSCHNTAHNLDSGRPK
jgi:predicted CXXCH cytochrome family protein